MKNYRTMKVEDKEVTLLVQEYLQSKEFFETLNALELESGLFLDIYDDDIMFLRSLILNGSWEDVIAMISPFENNAHDKIIFEILKQIFLEMFHKCHSDGNSQEIFSVLKEIESKCSSCDFESLCSVLSLSRINSHKDFKDWTIHRGRIRCFDAILQYLHNSIEYKERSQNIVSEPQLVDIYRQSIKLRLNQDRQNELYSDEAEARNPMDDDELCSPQIVAHDISSISSALPIEQNNLTYNFEESFQNMSPYNPSSPMSERMTTNSSIKDACNDCTDVSIRYFLKDGNLIGNESKKESVFVPPIVTSLNPEYTIPHQMYFNEQDISPSNEYSKLLPSCSTQDSVLNSMNHESFLIFEKQHELKPKILIQKQQPIRTISFDKTGKFFAAGCNDRSLFISKFPDNLPQENYNFQPEVILDTFSHHNGSIYSLSWSSDSNFIATGSNDKTIKIWHMPGILNGAYSHENDTITIYGHDGPVRSVSCSRDISSACKLFSAGSGDCVCRLWDINRPESPLTLFKGHSASVYNVQSLPGCNQLISGGGDATICLWDTRTGLSAQLISSLGNEILALAPVPSEEDRYVITSHPNGHVDMYDLRQNSKIVNLQEHGQECRAIGFSKNGKKFCTASFDASIHLYSKIVNRFLCTSRMKYEATLHAHQVGLLSVDWHPNDNTFLTSTMDGSVMLWS